MREDQPKNGKLEGNVDGSYHEKVDFLILDERQSRRKTNPNGLQKGRLPVYTQATNT